MLTFAFATDFLSESTASSTEAVYAFVYLIELKVEHGLIQRFRRIGKEILKFSLLLDMLI